MVTSWYTTSKQSNAAITLHTAELNFLLAATWFTCLDLKDTFFCLCLVLQSQPIFAFAWKDSNVGRKTQLA